jgi:hypothetical protein
MIGGDIGMERELLGRTGICGTSLEQLIGPLCDRRAFVAAAGPAGAANRFRAAAVTASTIPAINAPRRGRRDISVIVLLC